MRHRAKTSRKFHAPFRHVTWLIAPLLLFSGASYIDRAAIPLAWAAPASSSATDLDRIEKQIAEQKRKLAEAAAAEEAARRRLQTIQKDLSTTNRNLTTLQRQVEFTQAQIKQAEARLSSTQARYDEIVDQTGRRLRYIYMSEPYNTLEFLLSGNTLGDYVAHWEFLKRITNQDKSMLREIAALRNDLQQLQKELDGRRQELAAQVSVTEQTKSYYARQASNQQVILEGIQTQKQAYERSLRELEATSRRIQEEIRMRQGSGATLVGRGQMLWPASGPLTSNYGSRVHPIFGIRRMHTGIDIGAPSGAPVKAVGPGEVLFVGTRGGYGQVVIIDHGGGISTLYAHLSRIYVKEGQRVYSNDLIGAVGATGDATGPHLHFEVRKDGVPVDPMPWLK